ncbi:DUF3108 domain-containing protein [Phreatobacter aquaticus]|uniref:DUF3108 domain-containing protein n=1 Tax=Phreatobacter aquaticus TaxID=2570229 RepID=A0A4D7QLF6_9HYPH|nr:DUF3108 domain-containing protein [Phreatobacter aquaticus]QCK87975.1 DUF3108 domain-containing protein [Phreatobacter aquaticus]
MTVRLLPVPIAAALLALGGAAASAQQVTLRNGEVSADYSVSFLGLSIGSGQMVSTTTDGANYRTTLNARVTGIAAMFAGGTGTAVAQGRVAGAQAVPTSFQIQVNSGGKVETTDIGMAGGNVRSVVRNPDKPPHTRATPVTEAHLRGVLDPLSAGIFIASGSGPVVGAGACDQRVSRIYNGVVRFDLIYSFVETRPVDIAGYKGDAAVCRVRFEPVAGYRADRSDIQAARRRSAEVILVPVTGSRALLPAKITLTTGYGTGTAQATRLALDPGQATTRRASN